MWERYVSFVAQQTQFFLAETFQRHLTKDAIENPSSDIAQIFRRLAPDTKRASGAFAMAVPNVTHEILI